jgi:hypothetical protein
MMTPEDNMDVRWKTHRAKSIPKDSTDIQTALAEFHFYSGAMHLYTLLREAQLDETKKAVIMHLGNLQQGAFTAVQIIMEGMKHDQAHQEALQDNEDKTAGQFLLPLQPTEPVVPETPPSEPTQEEEEL